jgi:hypothetical protein
MQYSLIQRIFIEETYIDKKSYKKCHRKFRIQSQLNKYQHNCETHPPIRFDVMSIIVTLLVNTRNTDSHDNVRSKRYRSPVTGPVWHRGFQEV